MPRTPLCAIGLVTFAAALSSPLWAQEPSATRAAIPECSADSIPAANKAVMEREYARRKREEGKANADAWLQREAHAFVTRLVDQGICTIPAPNENRQVATSSSRSAEKAPLGKDGKPCKRTRMENRNVANVSGGPMMMVLVPVCAD